MSQNNFFPFIEDIEEQEFFWYEKCYPRDFLPLP